MFIMVHLIYISKMMMIVTLRVMAEMMSRPGKVYIARCSQCKYIHTQQNTLTDKEQPLAQSKEKRILKCNAC